MGVHRKNDAVVLITFNLLSNMDKSTKFWILIGKNSAVSPGPEVLASAVKWSEKHRQNYCTMEQVLFEWYHLEYRSEIRNHWLLYPQKRTNNVLLVLTTTPTFSNSSWICCAVTPCGRRDSWAPRSWGLRGVNQGNSHIFVSKNIQRYKIILIIWQIKVLIYLVIHF